MTRHIRPSLTTLGDAAAAAVERLAAGKSGVEQHRIDPVRDRERWLALRRADVTGTEIGALAGVSPFSTPFEVYARKTSDLDEITETGIMRRGR